MSGGETTPIQRRALPGTGGKVTVEWTFRAPPHLDWVERLRRAGFSFEIDHDRLRLTIPAPQVARVIEASERAMQAAGDSGRSDRIGKGGAEDVRALYEAELERTLRRRGHST